MTASGLKKHLKQNHGDLIKSSHGITSGFLLDLNHYLPQMELIDSISGPNGMNYNVSVYIIPNRYKSEYTRF